MQQQTHLTSNKIPRQPKKIWKQVLLRKTKEKLYPKVLDNYRGSRDWQPNLLFDLIEFNSLRKTNRVMPELLPVFWKVSSFFEEIGVSPIKIF